MQRLARVKVKLLSADSAKALTLVLGVQYPPPTGPSSLAALTGGGSGHTQIPGTTLPVLGRSSVVRPCLSLCPDLPKVPLACPGHLG